MTAGIDAVAVESQVGCTYPSFTLHQNPTIAAVTTPTRMQALCTSIASICIDFSVIAGDDFYVQATVFDSKHDPVNIGNLNLTGAVDYITWTVYDANDTVLIQKTTLDARCVTVKTNIGSPTYDGFFLHLSGEETASLEGSIAPLKHTAVLTRTGVTWELLSGVLNVGSVLDICFMSNVVVPERQITTILSIQREVIKSISEPTLLLIDLIERVSVSVPATQREITLSDLTERTSSEIHCTNAPEIITIPERLSEVVSIAPCGKRRT